MTAPLEKHVQSEINGYLTHLAKRGVDLRFSNFNIDEIAYPVILRCHDFCIHVIANYLDPRRGAAIVKYAERVKSDLLFHIRRIGPSMLKGVVDPS